MSFIKDYLDKLCCKHDWELEFTIKSFELSSDLMPYKITRIYKCKKCGKFKKIRL